MLLSLPEFKNDNYESRTFIDSPSNFARVILVDLVVPVGVLCACERRKKRTTIFYSCFQTAQFTSSSIRFVSC